jgi:hypothetical protein
MKILSCSTDIFDGRSQDLADTPRLRDAAPWMMGRITVRKLRDLADAGIPQMSRERIQPLRRPVSALV